MMKLNREFHRSCNSYMSLNQIPFSMPYTQFNLKITKAREKVRTTTKFHCQENADTFRVWMFEVEIVVGNLDIKIRCTQISFVIYVFNVLELFCFVLPYVS